MHSVKLEEVLKRSTRYEDWRAPLSPPLREAALVSGLSALVIPVLLWVIPLGQAFGQSGFFIILGNQFSWILYLLVSMRPVLLRSISLRD